MKPHVTRNGDVYSVTHMGLVPVVRMQSVKRDTHKITGAPLKKPVYEQREVRVLISGNATTTLKRRSSVRRLMRKHHVRVHQR